jgi:hypothetical protein
MPRIDLRRRTVPSLGSLRQPVIVCTTVERPDGDVSTIVERPGVFRVHGRVRAIRGDQVLDWKGVFQTPQVPTHEITIRTPPDVKLDLNHWVYVADRYAETWYKVRTVEDLGGVHRFTVLMCTIETVRDRRADPVTQAPAPTWERPLEAPAPLDDGF